MKRPHIVKDAVPCFTRVKFGTASYFCPLSYESAISARLLLPVLQCFFHRIQIFLFIWTGAAKLNL